MSPFLVEGSLILLGLTLSAVFSLAETSFLSLSRLQLARLEKVRPGRLSFWIQDPDQALAVLLLGNNMVHVGIGFLATALALKAERLWGLPFRRGGPLFTAGAAGLVILFGEIIPKVAARLASERIALALAPTFRAFAKAGAPLVRGLVRATAAAVESLSDKVKAEGSWDPHVMRVLLEGTPLSGAARGVVRGLLDFGRRRVEEVMVPLEEVFAVDLALSREELMRRVAASEYSRVPVLGGGWDRVAGVLYAKDLLAAAREAGLIVVQDLIRPLPTVSAEETLPGVLRRFREGHLHMALAVDRAGRPRGLVALQDLIEAIVGPVADEPPLKS